MKITKTEGAALAAAVATIATAAGAALSTDWNSATITTFAMAVLTAVLKAASTFQTPKAP